MIDRKLIDGDKLIDALLDTVCGNVNHWIHLVEIIPDYMPPYPRPDTRPKCVVRFKESYLRNIGGPRSAYVWDCYGDDMISPEWAILAVAQAPVPPSAIDKSVWEESSAAQAAKETT